VRDHGERHSEKDDVTIMSHQIIQGDCLEIMRQLPADSVDLVFGSPPYEQARLYLENGKDMKIARNTEDWVAWMVEVFKESLRVCTGLVAFVVNGQTRKFRWSAGPALLMADLHRAGIHLRTPPIFHRVGIPGSGTTAAAALEWGRKAIAIDLRESQCKLTRRRLETVTPRSLLV